MAIPKHLREFKCKKCNGTGMVGLSGSCCSECLGCGYDMDQANSYKPSKEEEEEQLLSFAYGNIKISNADITKEAICKALNDLRGR